MGGVTRTGGDTIAVGDTVAAGVTVTGGDAIVVALLNSKSVEIDGEKYFHISVHSCDRFKPRSRVRLKLCPIARG